MASKQHEEEVKAMIDSLYKFAGVAPSWDGEVNEKVAEVFGIMIHETARCSNAIKWLPAPPGGPASILWLAMNFGKALFKHFQSKVSITCAKGVIYKWKHELDMASMGLAYQGSTTKWV
ncbi:hypothetical protein RY831_08405 [Noviherbaspirillum sp. CPCC 100848]|uniref:Uncharacterized protein n=1 Tax=Noviherbaspirillum album TaxID=3080276 RepID=A0ABU6J6X7_9BURK|nr:hypothetical protein [Noviherbaspirillum sp. CPCC 100848]MEC4719166.1 hypothetical protein [Noviherbaspirillum sp. CPCC 100848]